MPNTEARGSSANSLGALCVRRDPAKGKIFSHIRQDWFVEFPEELVRQQFVCTLVNDYGFSLDQMGEELEVQRGREAAEADIVIWRTARDKADEKAPLIITECKSDNAAITARDYGQGESYARIVDAPFFVTHNNRETKFWRVKKDRMPGYTEEITDIPRADATDKEIGELIKKLKVFKEDEFADLLHQCHNVIRNREHLDPAAAFDEIAKVLFMKVCFERRLLRGRDRRNRFTADYLDEKADEFKEPVKVLFEQTKEEYEADYLFANDEEIRLKLPTVREIVRLLERYNLSDTNEDVKGIAFEKFLGRTFRGEIGQFFTPREIVRFMVEMAEPKFGDIICDPASGSGGFLIRFFANVREQILAEADGEYAKFKAELEKRKLSPAKRAELLREKWQHVQRDLDPKNTASRMWELSNRCVYGTDANDRMARTSKMNMIMHGDGHGGVHHWNGFLNVNGIFDGRFNILLTNPPFGAHVEATALVEIPEGKEWNEAKKRYAGEYGQSYRDTVARVEAAKGKPIASLFELPKRGNGEKPSSKLGKIKTELLFIERCLDLLQPGGRLGIVLPEGVFNNPSLGYVREFVEDRALLRAVISLPPETFFSSGASVKASVLLLQKFSDKEQANFDKLKGEALTEIEAKYADEIECETTRLETAIEAAKATGYKDARKECEKELKQYRRAMADKVSIESRALLKQRFNYPVFLYEAEHVGITATGERDVNELYPNERQPSNDMKTCVEHYRAFQGNPTPFQIGNADRSKKTPTELTLLPPTPQRGPFALLWDQLERWDTFFYREDFLKLDWDLDRVAHQTLGEVLRFESRNWKPKDFPDGKFRYIEIGAVTKVEGIQSTQVVEVANAPSRATTLVRAGDIILSTTRPYLGAFAIVPPEYDGCICSSGFALATGLRNDAIDKEYLLLFLRSEAGLKQMERRMTGGLYPAIVQDELEKIRVPLLPREQQEKTVEHYKRERARIFGEVQEAMNRAKEETAKIDRLLLAVGKRG